MIVAACRDHEQLRFDHRSSSGVVTRRSVEPYRLVYGRRRWYLVSWDVDRDDWRTFRVDRMELRTPNGPLFTPRALPPDEEIAERVARDVGEASWRYRARVIVHASAPYVQGRLPIAVDVEPLGEDRCAFEPGSDHPEMLALYLGMLDADFEIVDSPELADALRTLTSRYRRGDRHQPGSIWLREGLAPALVFHGEPHTLLVKRSAALADRMCWSTRSAASAPSPLWIGRSDAVVGPQLISDPLPVRARAHAARAGWGDARSCAARWSCPPPACFRWPQRSPRGRPCPGR